ncbi:hypothetical protein ABPG77_000443 [Micractinium sp. CCAP 211/92]
MALTPEQLMALALQQAQPQRERRQRRHERQLAAFAPVLPGTAQQSMAAGMPHREVQEEQQHSGSTGTQYANDATGPLHSVEQQQQQAKQQQYQQHPACSAGASQPCAAPAHAAHGAEAAAYLLPCSTGLLATMKRKSAALEGCAAQQFPHKRLAPPPLLHPLS